MMVDARPPVLRIEHLRVSFRTGQGSQVAVEDVSLEVKPGQIVALVGESGSGKSVTAMAAMGLIDPPGQVEDGNIWLGDCNLRTCSERQLQQVRGQEIAVIFQDPVNALNPVISIGKQLVESVRQHRQVSAQEAKKLALSQMQQVGLAQPDSLFHKYPFQISGGMCQRVMIANALLAGADLLIADEPTTALDVTIQAQILKELNRVRHEAGMSILLITHDLGVVAELADYVYVMRAGRIVEQGDVYDIFAAPKHPYTKYLLDCR
ncbi:ABC transporter ATP-binding protein [Paenibacillus antibioticophila]|uniref:ABC transporter ATP-binding protein n=1 Tax=Paenibacillus antibioticophila TaxID=1274374 RepID=UPI0006778414|nr:ABC transporter ATP-binding protein [Paenibacillus antibioticophila]